MINYAIFVKERFKTFGPVVVVSSNGDHPPAQVNGTYAKALTLHHATTGLVGEALEIMFARDRTGLLKEFGDYEFYLEALTQNLPPEPNLLNGRAIIEFDSIPYLYDLLAAKSADLLDLTKKMWIYEQEVDWALFWAYRGQVRAILDRLYDLHGTSLEFVLLLNVDKLLKRYPTGYSNQAAQTRADGEEQRHDEVAPTKNPR